MAGLNDLTQAAFEGGKPGPKRGQDTDEASALRPDQGTPRPGSNLILDAFSPGGSIFNATSRRERAMERRKNGKS